MTTGTDSLPTAADQIKAAGALLAILTAHAALPAPSARLQLAVTGHPTDPVWGVELVLYDGLDLFEQWRDALGLDPTSVDHKHSYGSTTAWLTATGAVHGVPVGLLGFYDLPEPATTWE
ncbi:hypothetical protein ACGFZP_04390 [Kitasatospora sp. NPDC048239]|uniref:hypothetical protein n=1 Tax=Kitasatospora sp. NPDC048239 TaxID=3364046 RepID=UPI003713F818